MSEWDDLKRAAEKIERRREELYALGIVPHVRSLLVPAIEIVRLIAQAERAERLEQVLRCAMTVELEHHGTYCADCRPILAALKGGE